MKSFPCFEWATLGEALTPIAVAIESAIYAAMGIRLRGLPKTPEKILESLRKKDSK
jgi:CO/xanthine dehydrogenase Mo-binding subunit